MIPSRADALHGGKGRSRAEAPGSSGSQGSLGGVGVSAQCRGKQDNWRGTGVGGFPQERSALQDAMSLKRGDCQGIPLIRDWRVVQGHNRTRILLCLVPYTPPQTQHQGFGPVASPNVTGMAGARTGAPRVMSQVVVRCPLVMTKETSFAVEKES